MSREMFLITYFGKQTIALLAIIFIMYRYVKKGLLVIPLGKIIDCKLKIFMQRNEKYITIFINIIVLCSIIIIFIGGIVPTFKDIPVVYRGEFSYVEGKAEKSSQLGSKNKIEHHNLYVKDEETTKIINLQVYSVGEIRKGTKVKGGISAIFKRREINRGAVIRIFISSVLIILLVPILSRITIQKDKEVETKLVIEVNPDVKRMLGSIDIIMVPIGIIAVFACIIFLTDVEIDIVNAFASGMTFVVAIIFHCMRLVVIKKKILVKENRLEVLYAWKKARSIGRENISHARIVQQTIILYNISNKKILKLTPLYIRYYVLIRWLELNEVEIIGS